MRRRGVLVTGATGTVGRALVGELLAAGEHVRAGVPDPDAAELPAGAQPVRLDPEGHPAGPWTLTGPEALDFAQAAALLSDELGRRVRYEPCSLLARRRALQEQGAEPAYVRVQLVIDVTTRLGLAKSRPWADGPRHSVIRVRPTRIMGRRPGFSSSTAKDVAPGDGSPWGCTLLPWTGSSYGRGRAWVPAVGAVPCAACSSSWPWSPSSAWSPPRDRAPRAARLRVLEAIATA